MMQGPPNDDSERSPATENAGCRILPGGALDSPTPSEIEALSVAGGSTGEGQAEGNENQKASDDDFEAESPTPSDDDFEAESVAGHSTAEEPTEGYFHEEGLSEQIEGQIKGNALEDGISEPDMGLEVGVPDVKPDNLDDAVEQRPVVRGSLKRRGGSLKDLIVADDNAQQEGSAYGEAKQNCSKPHDPATLIDDRGAETSEQPNMATQLSAKEEPRRVSAVKEDFEKLRQSMFGDRENDNQLPSSELELDDTPLPKALVQVADLSIQVSMPHKPYSQDVHQSGLGKGGRSKRRSAPGRSTKYRTACGEPPPRSSFSRSANLQVAMVDLGEKLETDPEKLAARSHQGIEPSASPAQSIGEACRESFEKAAEMPWTDAILKKPLELPPVGIKPKSPKSQKGAPKSPKSQTISRLCDSEDWQRRHLNTPPSPNSRTRKGKIAATAPAAATTTDEKTASPPQSGDLQTVVQTPDNPKTSAPRPPPRSGNTTSQQSAAARVAGLRQHSPSHKERKSEVQEFRKEFVESGFCDHKIMPWMAMTMQEPPIRWQKYFEREKPVKDMTIYNLKPGLRTPMLKS